MFFLPCATISYDVTQTGLRVVFHPDSAGRVFALLSTTYRQKKMPHQCLHGILLIVFDKILKRVDAKRRPLHRFENVFLANFEGKPRRGELVDIGDRRIVYLTFFEENQTGLKLFIYWLVDQ